MKMMKINALVVLVLSLLVCSLYGQAPTPLQRAQELLGKMTFDEKMHMLHGNTSGHYAGNIFGNPSLSIPTLSLQDGPQGVGDGVTNVTCFPSAFTVVASFDVKMMYLFADAFTNEQKGKGTNIILGPMVNIARVPFDGRNYESFGEDPFLSSAMVRFSIRGIQDNHVIATVKHFVNNNQEFNRTTTSANVNQRAQYEIYYPAFQAAIEEGVGAVMCSYNRINDTHACENEQTLNIDLKGHMGFQGFVMSDWFATHSTVNSANNGLDMEMPDSEYFGEALYEAVNNGSVSLDRIDDMVTRILTSMFAVGLFDFPQPTGTLSNNVQSPWASQIALELAIAGTVLLKNDNSLLPIDPKRKMTIAILGDDAFIRPTIEGIGSGYVIAPYVVTPYEAIRDYLWITNPNTVVMYAPTSPLQNAMSIAKDADYAIVFVATDSGEGMDRTNLTLSDAQNWLVEGVASVQPKTIVVAHTPSALIMPWVDNVNSILCAFLPGQENGNAIASVLFGDSPPSGRLPVTFPNTQEEIPVNTVEQYPGIDNNAYYTEQLLVGYRWYDHYQVEPEFPFGHGLTYTTFLYKKLYVGLNKGNLTVSVIIFNDGLTACQEVPQLYLGFPESANEPPQVLRGFLKTPYILPNTFFNATFETLTPRHFSIYNMDSESFEVVHGQFTLFVGASSRDIRLTTTITY